MSETLLASTLRPLGSRWVQALLLPLALIAVCLIRPDVEARHEAVAEPAPTSSCTA